MNLEVLPGLTLYKMLENALHGILGFLPSSSNFQLAYHSSGTNPLVQEKQKAHGDILIGNKLMSVEQVLLSIAEFEEEKAEFSN